MRVGLVCPEGLAELVLGLVLGLPLTIRRASSRRVVLMCGGDHFPAGGKSSISNLFRQQSSR